MIAKSSRAILLTVCTLAMTWIHMSSSAQVGINTISPVSGAILDITSSNKGLLIPRVTLTGTDDVSTIKPVATTGLMVYNTVIAGTLAVQVTPGFYYWSGTQWRRLYNQGYTLLYEQTSEVNASSSASTYVDLPGLDTGEISIPFSGTYQIVVQGYLACGSTVSGHSGDSATQGSISLAMETNDSGSFTTVDEVYITSSSKDINGGNNWHHLGQAGTIIFTVDLDVNNTYQFKVQGREWHPEGANRGVFGMDTNTLNGSSGVANAQRGSMTVTLVKQQ